jgi:ATP-dependent Clp endopeptidase proteolytic subunit ClpP
MSTENILAAAVAASADPTKEAALKLEQLKIQVEQARLELRAKRRNDRIAAETSRLDLRNKRNIADKTELELKAAQRAEAIANCSDFENREFMFAEGVNWDSHKEAIAELSKLSRRHPGKPLTITLNSPGGSVIAGRALYDHLRDLAKEHHITVKCRGMAASMGGILLQAGDKRIIGPESMVLIHEVSSGTVGKVGYMEDSLEFSKMLWVKLSEILAKRSKMSAEEIRKKTHKFDWWLSAQEAVDLGFADEIG